MLRSLYRPLLRPTRHFQRGLQWVNVHRPALAALVVAACLASNAAPSLDCDLVLPPGVLLLPATSAAAGAAAGGRRAGAAAASAGVQRAGAVAAAVAAAAGATRGLAAGLGIGDSCHQGLTLAHFSAQRKHRIAGHTSCFQCLSDRNGSG
jgi:hypothetical protein